MNEVRIHRATGEFLSLRFAAPATKDLSIVVPVKNEAMSAAGLAVDISFAMEKTPYRWECIWVDDGSSDNTVSLLEDFRRDLPGHWILALSKGYGQSAALAAGIARARGRVIVTMDGDGENDPEEIPKLVSRLLYTLSRCRQRLARATQGQFLSSGSLMGGAVDSFAFPSGNRARSRLRIQSGPSRSD